MMMVEKQTTRANGEWAERGGRKTPERPFVTLDDNTLALSQNYFSPLQWTYHRRRSKLKSIMGLIVFVQSRENPRASLGVVDVVAFSSFLWLEQITLERRTNLRSVMANFFFKLSILLLLEVVHTPSQLLIFLFTFKGNLWLFLLAWLRISGRLVQEETKQSQDGMTFPFFCTYTQKISP